MAACLVGSASAQAAGPRGGGVEAGGQGAGKGQGHGGGMRMLKVQHEVLGKLGLSVDQNKRVEDLAKGLMAHMKDLRAKAKAGDKEQIKGQMKSIREDYNKSLMAILTPAQQTQYKQLMKEEMLKMRKEGGGKGNFGKGGPPAGAPGSSKSGGGG
jgi:Spy/CpxP family protein refolding chaperone